MNLSYILAKRTNGANPFKIFEAIGSQNQEQISVAIRSMEYAAFLSTAYWFGVSSVVKSNARMRCQVCNNHEGIEVHHRTYESHGREHQNMCDLVVLCRNCHGLFHGHLPMQPKAERISRKERIKLPRSQRVIPHESVESEMPEGETIVITRELIDRCRTNGVFTSAAITALGVSAAERRIAGWTRRLIGKQMTRAQYRECLEARYIYAGKRG